MELAIRIHYAGYQTNPHGPRVPLAAQKCLTIGQHTVLAIIVLVFIAFSIFAIIFAHKDGNDGHLFAHGTNIYDAYEIFGYCFLG